jgi:AraC-like DNA-binding protein
MSAVLLKDPAKNIKEVSHLVGFSCPELYSKVFKRLMHCSPKTYRTRSSPGFNPLFGRQPFSAISPE